MKFISKSSNLLIVLRPGISAQPLTGTPAKATVSVRFKDGVADVQQQELIDMMLAHPGFNADYISAEIDPFAATRQSSEPTHILTEMKFGTPVSRSVKGGNPVLSPEMQKLVSDMATEMAKKMLPTMVESTIKSIVENNEAKKTAEATSKTEETAPDKKAKAKEDSKKDSKSKAPEDAMQSSPISTESPLVKDSIS